MKSKKDKLKRSDWVFDLLKSHYFPELEKRGCANAIRNLLRKATPEQRKKYSGDGWNHEGFRQIKYVPDGFYICHKSKQIRILEIEDSHKMPDEKVEAYYDISEMLWAVLDYNMKIILADRFGLFHVVDPEELWVSTIPFRKNAA